MVLIGVEMEKRFVSTDTSNDVAELAERGMRWVALGVAANTLLALVKIAAGILGRSYALVADGLESTLDVVSSIVVWSGLRIASVPPDTNHPYGHGKAEPLAGLVVAIMLVGAAVWIAVHSIHEIVTPHLAPAPFTLIVLAGVIVVKEVLYRTVLRVGRDVGSTAMLAEAGHHRSDVLTSAAAAVGISVALLAGEGYESADDWAALFACGVIAFNGWRLMRPALGEMMDAAPDPAIAARVRDVAGAVDGVAGLDLCRIRKIGLALYVDLHVLVRGELSVSRGHEIAHAVKDAVRHAEPRIQDVTVHIEPARRA